MNRLKAAEGVDMAVLDKAIAQLGLLYPGGVELPGLELVISEKLAPEEYLAQENTRGWTLVGGSPSALRQAVLRVARRSKAGLEPFPLPEVPGDQLAVRGVVEGFYGPLWKSEDRQAVMRTVARFGGTHYLYAPKADKSLRENWREPFKPAQLERVLTDARHATLLGLVFGVGISPGLDVVYDDPAEQERLVEKLLPLLQAGYTTVGVFLDDLDPHRTGAYDRNQFENLSHAQAFFLGGVMRQLRGRSWHGQLIACPTRYHGNPRHNQYTTGFGAHVPADVVRLWTGPKICSSHIGIRHTQAAGQVMNGPLLYWDNYPVNDASMVDDPHLGPLQNRSPYLGRYCLGALYNPAVQAHSGRIALGTCMNYAHGPHLYTPEESWEWAVCLEAGAEWLEPLRLLRAYSGRSPWQKEVSPAMASHAGIVGRYGVQAESATLWHLESFRQDAHTVIKFFDHHKAHPIAKDLAPWVKRLGLFECAAHELLDALAGHRLARNMEVVMAHLLQAERAPTNTCSNHLLTATQNMLRQMTELP